jgi:hypothetical protein
VKTRKFWIAIAKDEDYLTRFRISLLPFRYRKTPATMRQLSFLSQRSFGSERDAIKEARALFGNILIWKRNRAGQLQASFNLSATDLSN